MERFTSIPDAGKVFDLEELDLISWEVGDQPSTKEIGRVVALGMRWFEYVDVGSDMINLLCAKHELELGQGQLDELGLKLLTYLTE